MNTADKDATDYFRGVMATVERSERVLQLTEHIIRMNPAHYTVWSVCARVLSLGILTFVFRQYRYDTLIIIGASLEKELELMDEISKKFIKYYQVWHHRRLLQTKLCKPLPELTFIAKILAIDEKNYHTWAYRQWLLVHFNQPELWDGELPFAELLLSGDVRNNSAWHHRFFVVFETGAHAGSLEDEEGGGRDEVLRRELRFVKEKISLAPSNASAWNYLRGVCEKSKTPFGELKEFVELYTVPHQKEGGLGGEDYVDLENPKPSRGAKLPCPLAVEFLADIYVEEGESTQAAEVGCILQYAL